MIPNYNKMGWELESLLKQEIEFNWFERLLNNILEAISMPIRKVKGGYKIANTKGVSKTKTAAKKRLRAIKASQAKRKK